MKYAGFCTVILLIPFLAGCAAYVPTGTYKDEKVIASRLAANGTPLERIVETRLTDKRFYPATVEGPFVSTTGETIFRYSLRGSDGSERKLSFLEKKEPYEQILRFVALPGGRWFAINRADHAKPYVPGAATVEATVFDSERVIFQTQVVGCYEYAGFASSPPPDWRPLRPDLGPDGLNYSIDVANGRATFRTIRGDYVFNLLDGSLRKTP